MSRGDWVALGVWGWVTVSVIGGLAIGRILRGSGR